MRGFGEPNPAPIDHLTLGRRPEDLAHLDHLRRIPPGIHHQLDGHRLFPTSPRHAMGDGRAIALGHGRAFFPLRSFCRGAVGFQLGHRPSPGFRIVDVEEAADFGVLADGGVGEEPGHRVSIDPFGDMLARDRYYGSIELQMGDDAENPVINLHNDYENITLL